MGALARDESEDPVLLATSWGHSSDGKRLAECSHYPSIALVKHKTTWGGEGLFHLILCNPSLREAKAGTWGQEVKQRP